MVEGICGGAWGDIGVGGGLGARGFSYILYAWSGGMRVISRR